MLKISGDDVYGKSKVNHFGKNKDTFNKKPIYFAATVSENNQVGLGEYLQMEGMT